MNSSGIKRGLAAVAISALAVTGIPSIANADTLTTQETAATSAVGVNLRSVGTSASVANDGTNTTVSLVATGGSSVEYITFTYGATVIATVPRSSNGDFQTEWTPPLALVGTNITATRTDAGGAVPIAPAPLNDGGSVDTVATTVSGTSSTVEIAPKASLGYFVQPGGVDYPAAINAAGLSGTTSQSGGSLSVVADSLGVTPGTTIGVGTITAPATSQPWNGVVGVTAAAIAGTDKQALPVVETAGNSRDAQGFNLYAQTIGGINVTAAPVPPDTTTTDITVTVVDTTGQPVAGAKVEKDSGTGGTASNSGFTNGLGQVTFSGATQGTQSYYVETTSVDGYNVGIDFRGSVTTTASRATTVTFQSKDGNAFDVDESDAGDIRVQVKDAGGNPLEGQRFFYTWDYAPFVPSATNAAQTFNLPAQNVLTDAQGYAVITLPAANATSDQLGNGGTGGALTLKGYINRDGSNPGQDPVDLALDASTIKVGESTTAWDGPVVTDRQIGTTQSFSGSLVLRDGTGLSGRTLNVSYAPGGNSGFSATQPAGTTRLSNTAATVVTGADGTYSVSVTDPALPATAENGVLDALGTATVGAGPTLRNGVGVDANTPDLTVKFTADAAARNIVLTADSDTTTVPAAEADPYNELLNNKATPGRPVSFEINLSNSSSTALAGQPVTLTIDNGFFTANPGAVSGTVPSDAPGTGALTPAPAAAEGGKAGTFVNQGQTITVITDPGGKATVTVAIERNEGFDDDGAVTSNITATSGTATNASPIQVQWSSADALNPGSVKVEAAAFQPSGADLPDARAGQSVRLNVFAEDQFGNLTADQVVLSDDTNDAGFDGEAANGTLVVTSQFTSSNAAAFAEGYSDTAQTVKATWNQATNTYTDGNAATPGFQATIATNNTASVTDTADAINWYAIDFAASTFTLTSNPGGEVPVGTAVTETVKVLDQKGKPVQGLSVEFIRQGPASQDGDPNVPPRITNVNGEAFYSFTGTQVGTARISAVVTDGTQNETVVDTVIFKGATNPGGKSPITAKLGGRSQGQFDALKVAAAPAAKGAVVRLYKIVAGKRIQVGNTRKLNAKGNLIFKVVDRNGKKFTKYVAVVSQTDKTRSDTSNKKNLR